MIVTFLLNSRNAERKLKLNKKRFIVKDCGHVLTDDVSSPKGNHYSNAAAKG